MGRQSERAALRPPAPARFQTSCSRSRFYPAGRGGAAPALARPAPRRGLRDHSQTRAPERGALWGREDLFGAWTIPHSARSLAAGVVFGIEAHVVARVTKRLQGTIVQHGIALGIDGRQDRGSYGRCPRREARKSIDGSSVRSPGDAATASALLIFSLPLPMRYWNNPFRFPTHDGFNVMQCVLTARIASPAS